MDQDKVIIGLIYKQETDNGESILIKLETHDMLC